MTKEELHDAVSKELGPGGRMDNAHDILWDECEALRSQITSLIRERDEARWQMRDRDMTIKCLGDDFDDVEAERDAALERAEKAELEIAKHSKESTEAADRHMARYADMCELLRQRDQAEQRIAEMKLSLEVLHDIGTERDSLRARVAELETTLANVFGWLKMPEVRGVNGADSCLYAIGFVLHPPTTPTQPME